MSSTEDTADLLKKVMSMGIELGILLCLYIYDSRNLKQISNLIGERENTALHQVRKLVSADLIEIDAKVSAHSRGKFYKLTGKGGEIFDLLQNAGSDEIKDEPSSEDHLDRILSRLTSTVFNRQFDQVEFITRINRNLEKITINTIKSLHERVVAEKDRQRQLSILEESNVPRGELSFGIKTMKIYNYEQSSAFNLKLLAFYRELEEMKKSFSETSDKEFDNTQYIYIFTAPIFKDIID